MTSPTEPTVASAPPAIQPIFVGGSGRSGTTPTSRLLGHHSQLAMVPAEMRIHIRRRGLIDVLAGRSSLEFFMDQMRTRWYRRPHEGGHMERDEAGLYEIVEWEPLEPALAAFEAAVEEDPDGAARRLIHEILDPIAEATGAKAWVEHSPENVTRATDLFRLFSDMKFVHSVRDGRDVASSMTRVPWGPDNIPDAIRWWGRRLRWAHAEISALPADRVFVLRFEDLVEGDRQATYEGLLTFLELDDEPELRAYFDENIVSDRAHIGRWRDDVPVAEHAAINDLYESVLESLAADGVPLPATADGREPLTGEARLAAVSSQRIYELTAERNEAQRERDELAEELALTAEARDRAQEQRDTALRRIDEQQAANQASREKLLQRIDELRTKGREQRDRVLKLRDAAVASMEETRRQLGEARREVQDLTTELELLRQQRRGRS